MHSCRCRSCRSVGVHGVLHFLSLWWCAFVLWGRAALPRACEPETSRARAACTSRHACAPADLCAPLSWFLCQAPGAHNQELVAPAPTCPCRRSGGEREAKSIGVDRRASRTPRIAVQVAGGPWAASSSARSAHTCSQRRARRTRAERGICGERRGGLIPLTPYPRGACLCEVTEV